MNEHCVVIYVNRDAGTFTATARKESARLVEVDAWAVDNGFTREVVAQYIAKRDADALKRQEISRYRLRYTYVSRPPL